MKSIFSALKAFIKAAGEGGFTCHGARMDFAQKPSPKTERTPE